MPKYDLLIIGPQVGLDYVLAKHLSLFKLKILILRRKKYKGYYEQKNILQKENIDLIYFESSFEALKYIKKSNFVVSFTGSLIGAVKGFWFVRKLLNFPPVCNINTGSDLQEFITEKTFSAFIYRYFLKTVDINWINNYKFGMTNAIHYKLPNIYFFRFPFEIYIDDEVILAKKNEKLTFFYPSNIDFGVNKPKDDIVKSNYKYNNKFINAFIRALEMGFEAECILLDRGVDKEELKKIINKSKFKNSFIWKNELSRLDLKEEMLNADVIVDSFHPTGGLGGINVEAMSLGKPVIGYLDYNTHLIEYPEPAPMLSCFSEDEIFKTILKCKSRSFLDEKGRLSKKWIKIYHNPDTYLLEFLFHYQRLSGNKIIDYIN